MREILFRGKDIQGYWHIGLLAHMGNSWYISNKAGVSTAYEVIPETIGLYTGLTDKNGTKIFEGDIVKFSNNIYQISFESGSFILLDRQGEMISKIGGENDHCYSLFDLSLECCWEDDWAVDIEVLGNIHDNPELLKGGANDEE